MNPPSHLCALLIGLMMLTCSCHSPGGSAAGAGELGPYRTAQQAQGVYVLMPREDAANPRVVILSPRISSTDDTAYALSLDVVLIERGDFFDQSTVTQWENLPLRGSTIYTPDGRLFGRFLDTRFTKLWLRGYSSDTDHESTWEAHFTKLRCP